MEEEKKFIPPLYAKDNDDIEDEINLNDEGEEETDLDNKKPKMSTTTPFSKPPGGTSWGQQKPSESIWQTGHQPPRPSTWGNGGGSTWGSEQTQRPTWGSGSPTWGSQRESTSWNPPSSSWGGSGASRIELDRTKKVVFCDVLDCLVETYQSNGRPGLAPRGIYDIKLRFDVWDKIGCIGPERIYAMIPKEMHLNTIGSRAWQVTLEYICCCLTEYLRVPFTAVQIVTQCAVGQPKEEVIGGMIDKTGINPDDVLYIGLGSGLPGQHNRDSLAANNLGISYVDLGQLMTQHF